MKTSAVTFTDNVGLSDYCDEFDKVHEIDNVLPLFPKTDMFAYRGKRAVSHLREESRRYFASSSSA